MVCEPDLMAEKSLGKQARLNPNKYGASQNRKSFSFVRAFLNNQVEPIFDKLYDENFDGKIKPALRNYLIVSLVSAMEYFFRNEARRVVDDYDKDITLLFSGDIPIPISSLDQLIREKSITKGNIVASSINFANLDEIHKSFSKLFGMNDFFDYVTKLERSNPSRSVRRGHGPPIDIDIEKLQEAFRLRNEVVHAMHQVELSNNQLVSRWDNLMNIMDAAIAIFDPTLRSSLDEQVGKQTQKDIDKRRKMEEQSIGNKSKDELENEAPIGSFMEMVESQIDHL